MLVLGSHFYLFYDSARGITSMIQKRLNKLREMILDRVTLKQDETMRTMTNDGSDSACCRERGRGRADLSTKSAVWCGMH